MKRRLVVVGVLIVVVAIVGVWRLRGGSTAPTAGQRAVGGSASRALRAMSDPRMLARGSISGTVRDEAKAPVVRATVCASALSRRLPDALTRAPVCGTTDDQGRYQLTNLLPADYIVAAGAPQFRPVTFLPSPDQDRPEFPLAAGEARTGVDLMLRGGGVEITGVVLDVTGGPITRPVWQSGAMRQEKPRRDVRQPGVREAVFAAAMDVAIRRRCNRCDRRIEIQRSAHRFGDHGEREDRFGQRRDLDHGVRVEVAERNDLVANTARHDRHHRTRHATARALGVQRVTGLDAPARSEPEHGRLHKQSSRQHHGFDRQ